MCVHDRVETLWWHGEPFCRGFAWTTGISWHVAAACSLASSARSLKASSTSRRFRALDACPRSAIEQAKINGSPVSAIPEHRAVGGSQLNGEPERAVQEAEGMLRTMELALEEKLNARCARPTLCPNGCVNMLRQR